MSSEESETDELIRFMIERIKNGENLEAVLRAGLIESFYRGLEVRNAPVA